jgi:hypothetical protein
VVHPLSSSTRLLTISARAARHGLIGAECRSLTGGMPDATGVATAIPAKGVEAVQRAAFVQQGLAVIATAQTFDELVDAVNVSEFDADRFRIDVHDPADRSTKGTTAVAIALADVIPFGPDLRVPAHRVGVDLRRGDHHHRRRIPTP